MEEKEKSVVIFPNLGARLREKGFDALHNKQFSEALHCFEQLCKHRLEDEQSEFAAVVCLMEMHELQEARIRCENLLQNSKSLFFEVLEMQLAILVQLHDYEGVAEAVQEALSRPEVTESQREKLYPLLSFSEKMEEIAEEPSPENEALVRAFAGTDVASQLQALQYLRKHGRVQVAPFLLHFLQDDHKHPYVKSALLELLRESGVSHEVEVAKFGQVTKVIPRELASIKENAFFAEVLDELEGGSVEQNPTMLQALAEYWHDIMYLLFPFSPAPSHAEAWAAALEKIGNERFLMLSGDAAILAHYGISIKELETTYGQVLRIEQEGFLPV